MLRLGRGGRGAILVGTGIGMLHQPMAGRGNSGRGHVAGTTLGHGGSRETVFRLQRGHRGAILICTGIRMLHQPMADRGNTGSGHVVARTTHGNRVDKPRLEHRESPETPPKGFRGLRGLAEEQYDFYNDGSYGIDG